MAVGASKIDPLLGGIRSQDRVGTSTELERNTPVLSRVLFQIEDSIEVEEILELIVAPNSPLHPNHPDILLYVGTSTHRPLSPGLHISIPSMTTTRRMASMMSVANMQTPIFVRWGGTISIASTLLAQLYLGLLPFYQ